jgi:hypothetical protein
MEDLDKKIIELMDLFDDEQVTTADKIDRPERAIEKQAIDDFMKRNPMAGGGMLVQPGFGGVRQGYADKKKEIVRTLEDGREYTVQPGRKRSIDIDDQVLVNKWRNSLKGKNPVPWLSFLKNNFDEKTANALKARINKDKTIQFDPAEEFNLRVKQAKTKTKLDTIQKLVDKHNKSESILYKQEDIFKKLGVTRLTNKDNPQEMAIINTMDKPEDKVKKAFDKIITEDIKIYNPKLSGNVKEYNIIYKMISDIVSPKKGSRRFQTDARFINKVLSTHKPYLEIKENFDYFVKNAKPYIGQNFQEAFERAKIVKGGVDVKNITSIKPNYAKPEQNIYSFALRHALINHKNNKPSQVTFYKINKKGEPTGKPINFDELPRDAKKVARIFDTNKYGFEYKGQFFNKDNLKTKGFQSGYFKEVYDMTGIGRKTVPDPNDPGKKITLQQLLNDTGDKLTIGHNDAKGGVGGNPFNNLRIEGGKFNATMFQAYDKIKNPELRKMVINNLQNSFGTLQGDNYEKAFIDSKSKLAKAMFDTPEAVLDLPSYYRDAGQKAIVDLGQDFSKKSPAFQKEALRVAGLKDVKGLVPFMKNLGIKCQLSNGINCRDPRAYEKSLNELSTKAQAGDQAAAAKMTNFSKAVRGAGSVIKGVLGPAALVFEAGIAVPLGLFEYSQGKPATEIVDSLTYGLFGKSREDRLKEQMPAYGQVENLQNIDQRIQNLGRLQEGTRGQKLRSKPKFEKAEEQFETAAEPFLSLEDPTAAMLQNLKESENLRQKLIDEDLQRKQERKTPFDLSNPFMAAKGGRAGFKSGALRKGIQALIDKSVKSTPKDTTPDLDALIKKTLDEDFFDKKDKIIDNINAKISRARAKGLDSEEIGEGQLEFYDDITKSNFRTKTGPFFDRRKRAGGGILKQAGDSSGPAPESGPMSQGLQALMKRGIKT